MCFTPFNVILNIIASCAANAIFSLEIHLHAISKYITQAMIVPIKNSQLAPSDTL
jgi:hypothetical protein